MEGNSKDKWLHFESGKEIVVKFLKEQSWHEAIHRIGGKPVRCIGKGCKYCAIGKESRERDVIDVLAEGKKRVLTLPAVAYDQMLKECIAPNPLQGAVVGIMAVASGAARRYKFRKVEHIEEAVHSAKSDPKEVFRTAIFHLEQALEDLRYIYDGERDGE